MTLDIITSDTLSPLCHGFFGRAGGASSGVFSGLNCGYGSSDQKEAISINRARVAEAMGLSPEALCGVHQVHSADVITVTGASPDRPKADAMVTATPGVALSVLTADCAPVLFADAGAGVIGAAHAGWKGALGGVLEATIEAMEALGADRAGIAVVIGPTISQRAYEVGPEFLDAFLADDPEAARFFAGGIRRPDAVRPAGLCALAVAPGRGGRGRVDAALHLFRALAILQLPAGDPCARGRLRAADRGDPALIRARLRRLWGSGPRNNLHRRSGINRP
jgi:polyphenol oxidase